MSYNYNGRVLSINSPVVSISVNKRNIVVTDQEKSQLFRFENSAEAKSFLSWVAQA